MIEIIELNKQFESHQILSNVNLQIEDNTFTIIYGPSGSGKTTLLNLIGGLEKPTSGTIKINGRSLKCNSLERRNTFNYIFQNFALIDDESIYENLMIGLKYVKLSKKEKKQKIIDSLKYVKLDKDLNTKVYTLSGGEQQRVAIARSMLKPCEIILADEPTGSLDDGNVEIIMNLLSSLKKNKTIIMVSHNQELQKYADNIIHLNEI